MDPVDRHCAEIERCNQRGGRMLSIADLLDAGTVTPDLAAYLLAAIRGGASFMVGALPGGAGKTTVMGALLNFVPDGVELRPADGPDSIAEGLRRPSPRRCYICHEIGPGDYYAYLWGGVLRSYFELARAGHLLATNLHADTFEQARDQVCRGNGVPEDDFRRMHLCLFLEARGGWRGKREIVAAWESDGASGHRIVYDRGRLDAQAARLADGGRLREARRTLDALRAAGARTIEEVRAVLTRGR
jgi:hypothetical protein